MRGEHDKIGTEHRTPIGAEVAHRLKRARRARLRLGDGWIFPSPTDPERPFSRHLMRDYMERGLARVKITPGARFGWHSLRRKFATDLKHLPLVDLCALGGWKDAQTILKCYQRSDEGTMRRALEERSVQRGVLGS